MEEIKNEEVVLDEEKLEEATGGDESGAADNRIKRVADIETLPIFEELKATLGKLKAKGLKKGNYVIATEIQKAAKKLGYDIAFIAADHFGTKYWDQV